MDVSTPAATAGATVLSRYVLDDRIGGDDTVTVWRGTDVRLARAVGVRLLARTDPRADTVLAGARLAAAFTSRRAVPVLDVDIDEPSGLVVVVDEWVPGLGFGDYLAARGDRLSSGEATGVCLELSRVLAAAHADGLAHGALRPNSLLVTDSGEVRLRGLGIASALSGAESSFAQDAAADVHGVGSFLYLGLTGRWPDGAVDHVPGAARLSGGALPWPSRVVADVPSDLDTIAARAVHGTTLPKGRTRFSDVASLSRELAAAMSERPVVDPTPIVGSARRRPRFWVRAVGVVLAVAVVVAIAWAGLVLAGSPDDAPVATTPLPALSTGTPAPTTSTSTPRGNEPIPIVAIKDLDPYGQDKTEHPDQAPLAVDGNPGTSWTTLLYSQADMSGKKGVGLLLDLGAPRPVSSVKLVLVGNDTDVEVLAGDHPRKAPRGFDLLGSAQSAPTEATIRSVAPVTHRYLVVWLTRLPPTTGGFRGGVAEIQVFS